MSILGYKRIPLFKKTNIANSESIKYISDITDEKMQEIADALGCKLLIVTEQECWRLYVGDDDENGWECSITSDNYLNVKMCVNGHQVTGASDFVQQCRFSLNSTINNAYLYYSKGKNGAILFNFSNSENGINLRYFMGRATLFNGEGNKSVYGSYSNGSLWIYCDGDLIKYSMDNLYGYSDNVVLMSAIAIKDKDALINGIYKCDINKQQDPRYVFELNEKYYLACDGGYYEKLAIELDDSMLN